MISIAAEITFFAASPKHEPEFSDDPKLKPRTKDQGEWRFAGGYRLSKIIAENQIRSSSKHEKADLSIHQPLIALMKLIFW